MAPNDRGVAELKYAKDNRRYGFTPYAVVACHFYRQASGLIAQITWKVGEVRGNMPSNVI